MSDRRPSASCGCRTAPICRCRPIRAQAPPGLDLLAAVPADAPLTIAPGRTRAGADRHRDRAAAPAPKAQVRPRSGLARTSRRHGAQCARHDRCRLSRRDPGAADQSRRRAVRGHARHAHRAAGDRAGRARTACARRQSSTKHRAGAGVSAQPARVAVDKLAATGRNILPLVSVYRSGLPAMSLLPRKGLLAIAAVIDVALNARERPVSARKLAARHNLPPRHLEPVLQALVHEGIFNGIRGPRGGYELARERRRITVADILRAAGTDRGRRRRRAAELAHPRRDRAAGARPTPSARSRPRSRASASRTWRGAPSRCATRSS